MKETLTSDACALACVVVLTACSNGSVVDVKAGADPDRAIAQIQNPPWPTTMEIPTIDSEKSISQQVNASDILLLEKQGFAGDPQSARLLMQYYAEPSVNRAADSRKWRKIAAENGDVLASGLLSLEFEKLGGQQNCLRAKFWQERALRTNFTDSGEVSATHISNLAALAQGWSECISKSAEGTPIDHAAD